MTVHYFYPYDNMTGNPYIKSRAPATLLAVRGFLLSPFFMMISAFIACFFSVLGKEYTMVGIVINAELFGLALLLCDDFAAALMPFMAVMCQGATLYEHWDVILGYLIPWGILPALGLLFHLIVYRKPVKVGLSGYGVAATAFAVLLGGLGTISPFTPFESMAGAFYYFGLSFGMFFLYLLFASHYKRIKDYDVYDHFLWAMLFTGLIGSAIILKTFAAYMGETVDVMGFREATTFRNSLANVMIMGLPAPFYFACKHGGRFFGKIFSFLLGLLVFFSLCLTTSRTAVVCGVFLLLLCLIYYFRYAHSVAAKIVNGLILLGFLAGFLAVFALLIDIFELGELIEQIKNGTAVDELIFSYRGRMILFTEAANELCEHPLFGIGLLHGERYSYFLEDKMGCILWFHSYFPQVWASFGSFGCLAYAFHLGTRAQLVRKCSDKRSAAIVLTALSLFLYSMTDPGEFMPIPFGMMAVLAFVLLERRMEASSEYLWKTPKITFIRKNYKKSQKSIDKPKKI
jgi:hypothetical protein